MRALTISSALIMVAIFILIMAGSANAGTPPFLPTLAPGTPVAGNHTAIPTVRPTAPGTTIAPTIAPALVTTVTPTPTAMPVTPTPGSSGIDLFSLIIILIVVVAVIAAAGLYLILRR
jgi:hypothetical protein